MKVTFVLTRLTKKQSLFGKQTITHLSHFNHNIPDNFFYLYIYPPDSQESNEGAAITPTCFWRCQDIAVRLKFNRDKTEI